MKAPTHVVSARIRPEDYQILQHLVTLWPETDAPSGPTRGLVLREAIARGLRAYAEEMVGK